MAVKAVIYNQKPGDIGGGVNGGTVLRTIFVVESEKSQLWKNIIHITIVSILG